MSITSEYRRTYGRRRSQEHDYFGSRNLLRDGESDQSALKRSGGGKTKERMVFPYEFQPLEVDDKDQNVFTVNVVEGSLHLHTPLIVFKSAHEGINTLSGV